MWGNRFMNVIVYNRSQHVYEVDYNKFDEVNVVSVDRPLHLIFLFHLWLTRLKIDTPLCSARRLDEVCNEVKEFLGHDIFADYYHEHVNYLRDGSIAEVLFAIF